VDLSLTGKKLYSIARILSPDISYRTCACAVQYDSVVYSQGTTTVNVVPGLVGCPACLMGTA